MTKLETPDQSKPVSNAVRGQILDLRWRDMPDAIYVRGHITRDDPDAAAVLDAARAEFAEIADYLGLHDDDPEPWPGPHVKLGRNTYARWVFDWDEDGYRYRVLRAGFERGPGAFAVTEVYDLDEHDRLRLLREARKRRAEALHAQVLAWHPDVREVEVNGYGDGSVRFRLPLLAGYVRFVPPQAVFVEHRDLEAWRQHYAERALPADNSAVPE